MDTGEMLSELDRITHTKYHWIVLNRKQDKALVSMYDGNMRLIDITDDSSPKIEK